MKILMIGLGSIGQRHLRNIKAVYGEEAQIIAYRVRGLARTFSDTMQIRENVTLEEEYNITTYTSLEEALLQMPDIAFITNPTNMHISCALACAKANCHLFLEKPLSDSMMDIPELVNVVKDQKIKAFVGYQNRYHPAIQDTKKVLENGELGTILSIRSVVGERLKTMHTYEDYKETYMARKDMGGGVVTNQLVHELDYLYLLFGMPQSVYAVGGTKGNLSIDVEDNCEAIMTCSYKGNTIPISVHADFYQSPPSRFLEVVGTKGQCKADLIHNTFTKTVEDKTETKDYASFQRNDMFIQELKDFITCIQKNTDEKIPLEEGIASLQIADAIKTSMENGGIVNVTF